MKYRLRRAVEALFFCVTITLTVQWLIEQMGLVPALVAVNTFFVAIAAANSPPKDEDNDE